MNTAAKSRVKNGHCPGKEGRTITYDYDELNRLIRVIDPLGQATEYT